MSKDFTDMTESMHDAMNLGGDVDRLASFYERWAADYDADVASHGYGLPSMMIRTLRSATEIDESAGRFGDPHAIVLDAGCGTGLVGVALHAAGYRTIDGVDLSPQMVEVALSRSVYRRLEGGIDLTEPVPAHLERAADVVTVGGVFTVGHVPPEALQVMATLVRDEGLLVISTRKAYVEATDFVSVSTRLVEAGTLDLLVHTADAPYTMDSTGDYWAYRVHS